MLKILIIKNNLIIYFLKKHDIYFIEKIFFVKKFQIYKPLCNGIKKIILEDKFLKFNNTCELSFF
jgi:hypothetical protein